MSPAERGRSCSAPWLLCRARDRSRPGLCHTQATSEQIPLIQPLQGLVSNFQGSLKVLLILSTLCSWDDQWEPGQTQSGTAVGGQCRLWCPRFIPDHLPSRSSFQTRGHYLSRQMKREGLRTPALSACSQGLLAVCRAQAGRLRPQSLFCNAAASLKLLDVSSAARSLFLDTYFSAFPATRLSHSSLTGFWFLSE